MVRQRSPGNFEKDRIAEGGCRKVAAEPRIEKMGRGVSPSGPKPQARTRRLPPTQILPQSRRGAEEGILGILGILPRRAEIRVSQGLTRRHEATKKIRCRNGSPLPFQTGPRMTRIHANRKKWVGAARRADPRFRRERTVSPKPNPPAEAPERRERNLEIARDFSKMHCRSSSRKKSNISICLTYVSSTCFLKNPCREF